MASPRKTAREGEVSELKTRVLQAVIEGRQARSAYYACIGLRDGQELGPPASELQIARFEKHLGKTLSPSYRTFLSLHNGWRMVSGTMDLLSLEEMMGGSRHAEIRRWQLLQMEAGDLVGSNALVIGWADLNLTKLLLDPETMDENGEWIAIRYYYGPEQQYPSFLSWLEESTRDNRELLKTESKGSTPTAL
jgi:hypothetical protein